MSLNSVWKMATGRKTRKYNTTSDMKGMSVRDINNLDPDEVSKHILNAPDLTPKRKKAIERLLRVRDLAKKHGMTGKSMKQEVQNATEEKMRENIKLEAEADELTKQFMEEARQKEAEKIGKSLPSVPRTPVPTMSRRSIPTGGRRKSRKSRKTLKRRR